MTCGKDIERQLKDALKASGISLYELEKLTGVSNAALSRFMSGKRTITMETGAKLAKALHLELREAHEHRKSE